MWLRALGHVHGQLAVLAMVGLLHPALRTRGGRRPLSAWLATSVLTAAALLGAIVYPAYRDHIKPLLLAGAPAAACAFERKEHVTVAVVALAWTGLFAQRVHVHAEPALGRSFRTLSRAAYVMAALFALAATALGVWVTAARGF